jgi:Zn finger protein HypA/HybF involved in hydrogenase expression
MTSTGELGSLEDLHPEKRKQVAQIRKMRLQAHQQTQMKFSIVRAVVAMFSRLSNSIGLLLTKQKRQTQCELHGHSITQFNHRGCIAQCRFCGLQINSIEELQSVR